jgi:hypothetical protein
MEIKENDVFRWSYTEDYLKGKSTMEPYWSAERLIVVVTHKTGLLLADTFWGIGDITGKIFAKEDIGKKINVEYLGNLEDYERTEYNYDKYEEKDILILSRQHSCSRNCIYYYKRKGSVYSEKVIKENIRKKIIDNKRKIESLISDNKYMIRQLKEYKDGKIELSKLYY